MSRAFAQRPRTSVHAPRSEHHELQSRDVTDGPCHDWIWAAAGCGVCVGGCLQHALRSFVYTTAKSMLSFVTKESPIEPRTASFALGLDDPDRLRPSASPDRQRPSLSPALSHASIISPVPHARSSPLPPAAAAAAPVVASGTGEPRVRASATRRGAPADAEAAHHAEDEADHGRHEAPGSLQPSHSGGAEPEHAEQTEPAQHAASPPGTPPPTPVGLHWPTPTTPRRSVELSGRLETLHEVDGCDGSPDVQDAAMPPSSVAHDPVANGADGGPRPPARRSLLDTGIRSLW